MALRAVKPGTEDTLARCERDLVGACSCTLGPTDLVACDLRLYVEEVVGLEVLVMWY